MDGASRRLVAVLSTATLVGSLIIGGVSSVYGAKPTTGNPAGDLDQCANGGVDKAPVVCTGSAWQNGNLNGNQAHYSEGESVPYRLRMSNLATGAAVTHTVTIEWDTTQNGKHALDYLTSYNRTEATADPCSGVSGCSGAPSTLAITADPNVTGAGVTPVGGSLSLWGGAITSHSAYTLSGTFAGSSATRITINFTASVNNPVLAWGGHIATRIDWGQNNSAVAINGSPFHMRFVDLDGSGGNQDRSLSNDAVTFPATINIVKDTSPNASTTFSFTPGAGLLDGTSAATGFTLFDDGTSVGNTKVLSTITFGTNLTVSEADPAPAYAVTGACTENMTQDSSGFSGFTVTVKAQEGETITCTFTNTLQNGTITLTKVVQSNYGGNAGVNDFGLSIGGTSVSSGGSISATPGTTYAINETGLTGYSFVSLTGTGCPSALGGTVTGVAGSTISCTITNTDIAPTLALTKTVSNTSGGNNPKSDWTLTATPASGSGAATITGSADVAATAAVSNVAYTLSESSVDGYNNGTTWVCTGTGVNQSGNTVTLDEGATGSCGVTNIDVAPTLALTKSVNNTNGGNDVKGGWTLYATPPVASGYATISGSADVGATGAKSNVVYTLSESTVTGYTNGTTWTCTGTGVHQTGNTVWLDEGGAGSCGVTNTDVAPTLALTKTVSNSYGGNNPKADWTLTATPETNTVGATTISGTADVGATGAKSNVVYTLSESSVTGYTNGTSWTCTDAATPDRFSQTATTVTLFEGAAVTCDVTNTDIAPTLALDKVIDDQFGGGASEEDFVLTATPTTGDPITDTSGDVPATTAVSNMAYTLSESTLPGYSAGSWTCTDPAEVDRFTLVGSVVTLDEGAVVTCSITNSDSKASPSGTTIQRWVLHDRMTIAGIRGGAPDAASATVTFRLYPTDACSAASQIGSDEVVGIVGGVATTVAGVTVYLTGDYYWRAQYSGDAYNNGFTTACGDEVTEIFAKDAYEVSTGVYRNDLRGPLV